MPQDLNLTWASRLSAALVAAIAVVTLDLAAKAHGLSRWSLRDLAAIFVFASILLVLNLDLYRLFWHSLGLLPLQRGGILVLLYGRAISGPRPATDRELGPECFGQGSNKQENLAA
jgi:hypothetical protein